MDSRERILDQWKKAEKATMEGDVNAALFIFKKLDKEGVEQAAYEIGNIYEHGGGGVTKNHTEAVKWYEKSLSMRGDEFSKFGLAKIYFQNSSVGNNAEKAYEYFYALRDTNQPGALYALGQLIEKGTGITKDTKRALRYYEKAARYGHFLALNRYGVLLFKKGKVLKGIKFILMSRVRAYRAYKKNNYREDWRFGIKKVMNPELLTIDIKV